jgi:hypothetical protein
LEGEMSEILKAEFAKNYVNRSWNCK